MLGQHRDVGAVVERNPSSPIRITGQKRERGRGRRQIVETEADVIQPFRAHKALLDQAEFADCGALFFKLGNRRVDKLLAERIELQVRND
jgi:hypothetical protein